MSKVHKKLRRGEGKSADGDSGVEIGATGIPDESDVNISPEIEAFIADTRQKEKRLKEGIERLQEHARSLQQRLDDAHSALEEQEEASGRYRTQALERERELTEKINELSDRLSDVQADATHKREHHDSPRPRDGSDTGSGGSLLSQAKARK